MATRLMKMSRDAFGDAIRAAYEQGYIEGNAHPMSTPIIAKAKELSGLFWRMIDARLPPVPASLVSHEEPAAVSLVEEPKP